LFRQCVGENGLFLTEKLLYKKEIKYVRDPTAVWVEDPPRETVRRKKRSRKAAIGREEADDGTLQGDITNHEANDDDDKDAWFYQELVAIAKDHPGWEFGDDLEERRYKTKHKDREPVAVSDDEAEKRNLQGSSVKPTYGPGESIVCYHCGLDGHRKDNCKEWRDLVNKMGKCFDSTWLERFSGGPTRKLWDARPGIYRGTTGDPEPVLRRNDSGVLDAFIPSCKYAGPKYAYIFQQGALGAGYYLDTFIPSPKFEKSKPFYYFRGEERLKPDGKKGLWVGYYFDRRQIDFR
jgi:hypothetical protein